MDSNRTCPDLLRVKQNASWVSIGTSYPQIHTNTWYPVPVTQAKMYTANEHSTNDSRSVSKSENRAELLTT
jgi:hypothetical protein